MSRRILTIEDDTVLRVCDAFNLKLLSALWADRDRDGRSQKVEWDGGYNYAQVFRQPMDSFPTESGTQKYALVSILRNVEMALRYGERLLDTSGSQPYASMGGAREYEGFDPGTARLVVLRGRDLQIMQDRFGLDETPGRSEFFIECSLQANASWIGNDAVGNSRAMAKAFNDPGLVRV